MSATTVAATGALVYTYPELLPVLSEHLDANDGEYLPHVLLPDIVRWLATHVASERETCELILGWLGDAYRRGPDDVRDLIVVSGIEMIPDPGQPGSELRGLLGPTLAPLDPWRT
jgi:hypothetical protein